MMKKLLVLALASSAMIATPAAAADLDGIGAYEVTADVDSYCVFGQEDNRWGESQTNDVLADGNFSQQCAGADGAVEFDIQADDNTVQAAQATYVIDRAICNEAFNVSIQSDNGGLKTPATTSDDDFTSLVGYNVRLNFDGTTGATLDATAATQTLFTSTEAKAGPARLRIRVPASDDLLLEGSYEDVLLMVMQPNA